MRFLMLFTTFSVDGKTPPSTVTSTSSQDPGGQLGPDNVGSVLGVILDPDRLPDPNDRMDLTANTASQRGWGTGRALPAR